MLQGGALSLSASARTQGQEEVAALPWAHLTTTTALQQHLQEHHIAPAAAQASSIDAELRVLEPQLRRLATGAAPSTQAEDADDAPVTSAAPADADAGAATKVAAPQPRRLCRDLRRRVAQLVRDAAPLQRHAWFMSFLLKMPQVSGEGVDRVDVAWLQTAERGAWQQLARIDVALEAAERSLRQACLRQAEWDMLLHAAMRLDAAAPVVEVKRHIALLPALDHEARLRHAATGLVSALRTYAEALTAYAADRSGHQEDRVDVATVDVESAAECAAAAGWKDAAAPWCEVDFDAALAAPEEAAAVAREAAEQLASAAPIHAVRDAAAAAAVGAAELEAAKAALPAAFEAAKQVLLAAEPARMELNETTGAVAVVAARDGKMLLRAPADHGGSTAEQTFTMEASRLLGEGGFGAVYPGRALVSQRPVAIKVVAMATTENREAFALEARMLRLQHMLLGSCVTVNARRGRLGYLVMRKAPGQSLATRLLRAATEAEGDAALPARATLLALASAARALEALHAAGLLHNDVKPENLMVELQEAASSSTISGQGGGVVRGVWVDFGLAQRLPEGGEGVLRLPRVFGTPGYMAPEIKSGRRGRALAAYSPASDAYAFAVTVSRCLRVPWRHDTTGAPVDMAAVRRILDPAVEAGMAADPQARGTLVALREALQRAAAMVAPAAASQQGSTA